MQTGQRKRKEQFKKGRSEVRHPGEQGGPELQEDLDMIKKPRERTWIWEFGISGNFAER